MASPMAERFLMTQPAFPIFLFDGFDLSVASTLKQLQADLEPVDAQSGVFDTYDSEGRRVSLGTVKGRISAEVDPTQPVAVRDFEERLRKFLKGKRHPAAADQSCDLPCLIKNCVRLV